MAKNYLARCISLALAGCAITPIAHAQADAGDALLIRVTEGRSAETARLSEAAVQSEPVERLSSNPSVSLSRMGGRGLDPVIRGQNEERVDVLLDGMRVEGACPSRMDPPTSRLSTSLAPVLEVRTDNRTLRWGPVAGGQIVATTAAPAFADGNLTAGHLTLGASDNGEGRLVNGSAAVGNDRAYLRMAGGHDEADDYEDGDGREVRSSYENAEGRVDTAWTAASGLFIKAMASRQQERDVKFPGRGMDAPETDTDLYRLEVGAPVADGGWNLMTWQADVDHVMDNFSLREPPVKMGMPMKMLTDSETRTRGVRLTLDQSAGQYSDWAVGVDYESNDWDAALNNVGQGVVVSYMWPGVERDRVGVFFEQFTRVRPGLQLGGGLRYDRVDMDATRADLPGMGGFTALDRYESEYQTSNTEAIDDNISGFVSGEWRYAPSRSLDVVASHSVRSPGVTERYVNKTDAWVGNPGLDTEKHNKLEISLSGREGSWNWRPALWVDQVDDYVLRSQDRYTNIDARLLGVEGELGWSNGTWNASSKLASVRGENRDADKPLPRIPPVQFIQTVAWTHQGHTLEAEWALARRQDRIDEESGLDPGTSPGYGVLNLSGTHPLMANLNLTWALDNVFDKTWAPHVSKSDALGQEFFKVNEPGRTVRAALTARW
ncbi:TonB-dependent receptor [Marinobacter vulgaris]|uniref:TonB-dependent receptor n=1 Tax=Marinobacter vulgaris TaxID=1928331 RepID=A0A2V3ZN01_9GAMM|nr:TonB-dependent receptor [Marinobacter vulgaris]PXX92472.1 TonB-dependent receptor [Marinobacter vulgaris]TSJ71585.1 TonB-dependent receptor [Marinobacter vulgaris]